MRAPDCAEPQQHSKAVSLMVKQVLGCVVALFGLGTIGVGLYLFLTQPFVQGDPNGVMLRAVIAGIAGFLMVLCGWSMVDGQTIDGKPADGSGKSGSRARGKQTTTGDGGGEGANS